MSPDVGMPGVQVCVRRERICPTTGTESGKPLPLPGTWRADLSRSLRICWGERTIQKWERGEIRIALEDFLDVFDTLHLPVGPYEMWILHPELFPRGMEDIKGFSTEKKRRTLADYYLHQAAPLEIEQEYYILFGDHGSNSCGIRQELLANLQTPLRDRKRIVNQIIDNYYEARAIGHLTDPEGQQPVMPILEACYDASARSVKANENRYSIGSIEDYLDDAEKPAEE